MFKNGILIAAILLGHAHASAQFSNSFFERNAQARADARYKKAYKDKKENGDNVDAFYRTQGGFSYGILNTSYKLDYVYSGGSKNNVPINFVGDIETKGVASFYGVSGERYFPLATLSEQSTLALSFGVDGFWMNLKYDELRLNGGQKFTPEFQIVQFNIPIGLAYKSGTDVVFNRNVRSGFSFGAGIAPSFMVSLNGPAKWSARTFGMAELAFYTGFCWKIRGTVFLGKTEILNGSQNVGVGGSETESTMRISTNSGGMISLVLTDFSWDWDE
jgi:hypothetical protein